MKRMMRLISMLLCLLMMTAVFGACDLYEDETAGSDEATATSVPETEKFTDEELQTAVITIGEREVTLQEYIDFYEQIKTYYAQSYGFDIAENSETLSQYIDLITDAIIEEKIVLYKADEMGLSDLSEEQKKEVEEKYNADVEDMYSYYEEFAQSEVDSDDAEAIDAKVEEYVLEEAVYYCGEGATVEEYLEYLKEQTLTQYISELVMNEVIKDVEVTDDEIKEWYDEASEEDENYYKEHPESYKDETDSFEINGYISDGKTTVPPLYIPDGYSRIYHILITNDGELSTEYSDNESDMLELEAEYGELAFEAAVNGENASKKERMDEIIKEYRKLEEKNMKELEETYEESKDKAEEAYAKLEDGEDFEKVMKEYTQDNSFKNSDTIAKNGRLISLDYDAKSDWSSEVKAQFKRLEKGQYSEIFLDAEGYHIIYYVGDEKAGAVKMKAVKDDIANNLLDTKQTEAYDAEVTKWMEDKDGIVKLNAELISRVGH